MNHQFEKNAGYALIVFTILMTFTMVLHPAGGNIEYLLKIQTRIIATHAIALLSLPFGALGFWGLTKRLGTENFFSISAFSIIMFGLMAVMIAATANGLVLPLFIQRYDGSSAEVLKTIEPLLKYNFVINRANDYVYTAAFCLAILFWSVAIFYSKQFKRWLAYLGVFVAVLALVITFTGIASSGLKAFQMFVGSILLWVLLVGVELVRNEVGGLRSEV